MRFLIVEKIQGQSHIRASRASLKSAERARDKDFPTCVIVPIKTKKVSK